MNEHEQTQLLVLAKTEKKTCLFVLTFLQTNETFISRDNGYKKKSGACHTLVSHILLDKGAVKYYTLTITILVFLARNLMRMVLCKTHGWILTGVYWCAT